MVGKVKVRDQGPVRRKQTTTTYKTGGAVKPNKKIRTYIGDVMDATKKMSPHQDPKSERSANMRHSMDNPKKPFKKSPSPHSKVKVRKQRTLRDSLMGYKGARKKK